MLHAQTIAEIQFFLKVTGCEKCGRRVQWVLEELQFPAVPGNITVPTHCFSCKASTDLFFHVHHPHEPGTRSHPSSINPTDQTSQLIDLGQWITLAYLLMEESRGKTDKEHSRYLNMQASQCYDEALKFYDDPDNELPPPEAFFTETSRRRFRDAPQQFSRSRLLSEKGKLPSVPQ